jgi:hypothetical protein
MQHGIVESNAKPVGFETLLAYPGRTLSPNTLHTQYATRSGSDYRAL